MMNRRLFLGALATGALVPSVPFAAPTSSPEPMSLDELYGKAKSEGDVTWYIAYYRTEVAERVAAAFSRNYPGLKVNVIRASAQVIFQRLSQDLRAGSQNCDVFSGSDTSHYEYLKDNKIFAPYRPVTLDELFPVVREATDEDHYFTPTDTSMTMIVYGKNTVDEKDLPRRWEDFADPKWKGAIALPHPGYSGGFGAWVVAMNRLYGWDFIERVARNNPLVGRSLIDPPSAVANGERKLGIGTGGTIWSLAARGTPIGAIAPEEGVQLGYASSGVIAKSRRPHAARLFMEFLLSQESGQIAADQFSIPIRPDVEPRPGVLRAGSVPGFRAEPEEIKEMLPVLVDKWRDLFGV